MLFLVQVYSCFITAYATYNIIFNGINSNVICERKRKPGQQKSRNGDSRSLQTLPFGAVPPLRVTEGTWPGHNSKMQILLKQARLERVVQHHDSIIPYQ